MPTRAGEGVEDVKVIASIVQLACVAVACGANYVVTLVAALVLVLLYVST